MVVGWIVWVDGDIDVLGNRMDVTWMEVDGRIRVGCVVWVYQFGYVGNALWWIVVGMDAGSDGEYGVCGDMRVGGMWV